MSIDFTISDAQVSETLSKIIPQIVTESSPQKIILFGSAARNDSKKFNDIDLLIIVKDGVHRRKTAQHLYKTIRSGAVPVDFVVATETDIELYRSTKGYVYFKALKEGVLLYEK
ncbi:MAG: nucleotidyltransferase [Ignavibacteriaceae bacterium]|nr:MAG: nucleotidyltransferase [Ignavibacteriaceae bacterium]